MQQQCQLNKCNYVSETMVIIVAFVCVGQIHKASGVIGKFDIQMYLQHYIFIDIGVLYFFKDS